MITINYNDLLESKTPPFLDFLMALFPKAAKKWQWKTMGKTHSASKDTTRILFLVLLVLCFLTVTVADVVLDEKTMKLTLVAGELSALAYVMNPPSDGYDMMKSFTAEPDQALVVKKDGYCYGVFRGTTLTAQDWSQNLVIGQRDICGSDRISGEGEPAVCCTVRRGFYEAYHTNYYQDFETALRHCAKDCLDPDECVVLTGHSQGGAIAAVAGITLVDLNPYVVTFGQPPTLAPGCPFMASERWYRWVNTKEDENLGIAYDPVPFSPGLGTECWGHFLILGGNSKNGVAYLGLDDHRILTPPDPVVEAHTMKAAANDTVTMGYIDRIQALIDYNENRTKAKLASAVATTVSAANTAASAPGKGVFSTIMSPIPTVGFATGFLCSNNDECMSGICKRETGFSWRRCFGIDCVEDSECETNRCDSGECAPKLGSCQPCDENSDCQSGKCLGFQCTGPGQLMDDNCGCFVNENCRSGRCDGVNPRICEAVVPMDARCNEDSDCASGYCSWSLRCADPSTKGNEIEIENKVFSWRTPVVIAVIVIFCWLAKYGIEYWFDRRTEYQEIAEAEIEDDKEAGGS